MRLHTLLAALVAASLLAGCTATKDTPSGSTSASATATGSTTATGTGTAAPVEHRALLAASRLNGTAPLNVTFTVDAVGKDLRATWTLAFGDGNQTTGAALPSNATHQYRLSGNLTARLTVRFGDNATANATLALRVGGGSVALPDQVFHAEDTITLGTQGSGEPGPAGCGVTETVDLVSHSWVIASDVPAVVTSILVHMDLGETNFDSDIFLYGPDGAELGKGTNFNEPVIGSGSPTEEFTVEGPLPLGTYKLTVQGCVAVEGTYTIDATAKLASA